MKESLYRMKNWIINAGAINACRESYATNFLYFSDIFFETSHVYMPTKIFKYKSL